MTTKHDPEENISKVYLDLIKLENHVALLRRSLTIDFGNLEDLNQNIADMYLDNLETIQETIAQSQKSAVRVMCYFDGDSCD